MGKVRLLKASAGSGKTYRLAYQYVRNVVAEPMMYRHILAVTFTNKATEEMKRRILAEIDSLARGEDTDYMKMLQAELSLGKEVLMRRAMTARTKILHDYSHFSVLTIDKFFQRIIRSFVKELGIDLNFNLELRTDTLLSSAADALIDEIALNDSLRRWITDFVGERIAENKKWNIKDGLTELGGEIFGESYKRNSSLKVSKQELEKVVAAYSAKAYTAIGAMKRVATEALTHMNSHGLTIVDFPYGKSGFAAYFTKMAEGNLEAPNKRVAEALISDERWYSKSSPRKTDIINVVTVLKPLLTKLCAMYDDNIGMLNTAELLRENYRSFAMLTDLSAKIAAKCEEEGILPISETNAILNKLVSGNDTPFIFEKAGSYYSHFMIDEFQDTSAMQWENFLPLLRNSLAQTADESVLLVGDVKQSIYRWRGGDWRILASEIEREFSDVVAEDMTVNYRSLANVVEFNNNMIEACVREDNRRLDSELEEAAEAGHIGREHAARLRGMLANAYANHRQQVPAGKSSGYVNVTCYPIGDDGVAVPPVISRIEELQKRGYMPSDIAILVRYNADGIKVANMLLDHKSRHSGSPYSYDVVTQEALLVGSSPAVSFAMACLRLAVDPNDSLSRAVYNRWMGLGFTHIFGGEERDFFARLRLMPPLEAFEHIVMKHALGDDPGYATYLQAFHEQIIDFGKSTIADIPLFLKWWDENGATQSVNIPEGGSAINIITIHKAKGLQYKAVIVPYCDWKLTPSSRTILWAEANEPGIGVIPVKYKDKMRQSAFAGSFFDELVLSHVDNINTFYVAATRAREELHIMMPDTGKSSPDKIGSLITSCIAVSGDNASIGGLNGKTYLNDGYTTFEFGQPATNKRRPEEKDDVIAVAFRSYPLEGRLKIRYRASRYLEDGFNPTLSPRDHGVMMHEVFETAKSKEDVMESIGRMERNGSITADEAAQLTATVANALQQSLAASWFGTEWDEVKTENEIIVPHGSTVKRPDRVMICGRRAVVVDYKFGLNRPASHIRQIGGYMELLREMGYNQVEGYIWYVSSGEILPVQ